jgi:hypothetical protein
MMAKSMAKPYLLLLSLPGLAVSTSRPACAADTPRFDTAEISVLAARTYDGRQGSPNPFTDVTFAAAVIAPSGRIYNLPGFFDGDGQGGSAGRVFKVRVFADEACTWSWRTSSNVADLDGKTGSFRCAGVLGGPFATGPVGIDPAHPRRFRRREGPPVYLLGKFLDIAAPSRIRFSQTFFSEQRTDADREALLARHRAMRLNKINIYLANRGDYDGVATTPWVGSAAANDKARFDLARWHAWETWVLRLRDDGMLAHLWFFADDSAFGDLPDADRQRLVRYGMARLSGYVNTMFTLMLEWQEGWTAAEVQAHTQYLNQNNPWDRLVSVHGVPGEFAFPTASWVDFMDLQAGNEVDTDAVYTLGLLHRTLSSKPLLQEEHGLGEENGANRRKVWAAFFAGAGGSGTGAYLEPLARFLAATPFEKVEPALTLVTSGHAYAMSDPGKLYLFYLPAGGTLRADLTGAAGPLTAEWFDPRTGLFSSAPGSSGGGVRAFTAPSSDDWVLTVRSAAAGAPVASFYTLAPCRVVDTRLADGALRPGERRSYTLAGACGIPAGASAVAANLTAASPGSTGRLTLWPGGRENPGTSSLSFANGHTQANSAILELAGDGTVLAESFLAATGSSVHLIIDVAGYFQ